MESGHDVLAHVVLAAEAGPREGQPQVAPGREGPVLKLPHGQETVVEGGELQQAHPLVLGVLAPLCGEDGAAEGLAQLAQFFLVGRGEEGAVEYFAGRVEVGGLVEGPLALVLVLLLLLVVGQRLEDEALVVRVEHLEGRLDVVDLVLGLDRLLPRVELHQRAALVGDEDHLAHPPEVRKYVVDAVVVEALWQRPHEQHLGWAVLQQKLLGVGVDDGLGLAPVHLLRLLPGLELLALEGDLPELLLDVEEGPEGVGVGGEGLVVVGELCREGLAAVLGGGGLVAGVLLAVAAGRGVEGVEGRNVVLEGAAAFADGLGGLGPLLALLELLVVDPAEVVVLELDVLELGAEDVHLAAVLEDDPVVEVGQGLLGLPRLRVLHEGLPHFRLLEYEDLDNRPVGAEQLVEVVVRDHVPKLVVDAHQQHCRLLRRVLPTHYLYHHHLKSHPRPHTQSLPPHHAYRLHSYAYYLGKTVPSLHEGRIVR